jgi:hypothetical protein
LELSEVELIKVEPAIQLWVGSEQNLKTTIKNEAIDMVGANSASHLVGGLNDPNANASGHQSAGTGQSGKSCSNDHDIFIHGWRIPTASGRLVYSRRRHQRLQWFYSLVMRCSGLDPHG